MSRRRSQRSQLLWHRLLWLAIAAMVPLALIAGAGGVVLMSQQRTQAERASLDFTRAFANAIQAELDSSFAMLRVLSSSALLDHGDAPAFRALCVRVLHTQPGWSALVLADPAGQTVAHTAYDDPAKAPLLVERESFARLVAERQPLVGHLAQYPGAQWAVPIRYPVVRDGEVKYVLTGLLRPEAILKVMQRQRLPDDWVISVFDAHDMRIARSRKHEDSIATGPAPSLAALMKSRAREAMGVTYTLEGDRVYSAYVRLPDAGWTVAAGLPTGALESDVLEAIGAYGGALVLSGLLAAVMALLFARRINRPIAELRQAAQALGRGELPPMPRTDIVEVNDVAQTLLEAARQRARSEAEREALLEAERKASARAESARAQAESASRAKDEFLAMLGHELRNPLAPIVTALELMKMRNVTVAERERAIIERQVRHLSRLVDDLMDVSRITQGKLQLDFRRTDLCHAVDKAVELIEPAFSGREPLVLERPDEPVFVDGDEMRLTQIVSNLLANAVKFTPPSGAIRLSLAVEGGDAVLTVIDHGMGIAPALLPHVFEPFVQGEQALDRRVGGLGLGLGIVKMLVQLHGGSVSAQSDGPGRGSRFTVRLPRAARPSEPAEPTPAPAAAHHAGRVLLVDDNVDAAVSLAEVLRSAGYEVRAVYDGAEALAAVEHFTPDIALLDIGLPGMNGYELAAALRADPRLKGLLLIALTGYGREPDRARALAATFDQHFVKPVAMEALLDAMARRAPRR
jgi:signal transduction histidine kinase/ActR/RegA family two-component response regulator